MEPERVTQDKSSNEQLLYFTTSSLWSDDSHIVFISDRDGDPNIFQKNLIDGSEKQLTCNKEGMLKSYVYFEGNPYQGLGKASISLHSPTGTVYYIQGQEIRKVTPEGKDTLIVKYPDDQMTAFTHISNDGSRICVPTTDERALDGKKKLPGRPKYNIDKRVQDENLNSYLRVYDTTSGEELVCEQVPRCWITHVQFSPINNDLILYNHEWPWKDGGIRRMWMYDGKNHLQLRPAENGRIGKDGAVHEMWERDGSAIIYHGHFYKGPHFIGRVQADGTNLIEIPLPKNYKKYGHYTVGNPGMLVTDGYYEKSFRKSFGRVGKWISQVEVDWKQKTAKWTPLGKNKSNWDCQDAHPHPIFDHKLNYAYFTSNFEGKRAVYRIEIRN
jgi:oligogalacturonide lyase